MLVDDHAVVRHSVRRLISEQPDLTPVGEASCADEAAGEMARWADVAVIDYHLGDRDGLWLTRQIREREQAPRVLIYSAFADQVLTVAAIVAGAHGLLGKHALSEELCVAIRSVACGRRYFPAVPAPLVRALRMRLAPEDRPIYDRLMQSIDGPELTGAVGLEAREIEYRRAAMLRALAPQVVPARQPRAVGLRASTAAAARVTRALAQRDVVIVLHRRRRARRPGWGRGPIPVGRRARQAGSLMSETGT